MRFSSTVRDDHHNTMTGAEAAKYVLRHLTVGAAAAVVIIALNHFAFDLPFWSASSLVELIFLLSISATVILIRLDRLQRRNAKEHTRHVGDEPDDLLMPVEHPAAPPNR